MAPTMTKKENATVGALAGVVDITCIQWAYYLKNARQQGLPLTMNPLVLYRGYGANCMNVAAGTCFQFGMNATIEGALMKDGPRKLTPSEKIGSGFVAGFLSGIVASPFELLMTQQQLRGGSIVNNSHRLLAGGPSYSLRGLVPTCFREGIFAAAYLGLAPVIRTKLSEAAPGTNQEALRVVAAVGSAAVCGALSHPFDTVKTCMQGDVEQQTYGRMSQCFSQIKASGGFSALYRGIEFRFLRQVWQVWVLDLLREKLADALFVSPSVKLSLPGAVVNSNASCVNCEEKKSNVA